MAIKETFLALCCVLSIVVFTDCTKQEARDATQIIGTIALETCERLPQSPVEQYVCNVIQGGVAVAKVQLSKTELNALRAARLPVRQ